MRLYPESCDIASHPTDFCEILISRRKIVNSYLFFGVTNIRDMFKTILKSLNGYFTKCFQKKTFISQDIFYINENGERKLCTVSAYIKELLSILEIENKNVTDALS